MREASQSGLAHVRPRTASLIARFADRSRQRLAVLAALALTAGSGFAMTSADAASAATSPCPDANVAVFGPNVCVFNDAMSQTAIQTDLNNISTQQVPVGSQFDSQRYAIFFEPGTYGSTADPLVFQVGYYTEVAGLGFMPNDTVINGAIEVFNNLCTPGTSYCNSDDNFWRSLSNVTLNVTLPSSPPDYAPPVLDPFTQYCANTAEIWSASQASPHPAGHHQRQRRLPGLLREQELRQRRLHRRQPGQWRPRLLRQPAVHGPQRRYRRVQRVCPG